ncbi:hypothetical protein RYX36_006728, partial [Vicia faba]
MENGIVYTISLKGHKTGFYADQCESPLELGKENVVLKKIDPERISFLKEDATEFMKDALLRGESWDIVVIDPPKLAPSKK